MASATVGSSSPSCQRATGSWLVTMVRAEPGPVLDHFQQVGCLGIGERLQGDVEHEDVDSGPGDEQARQPAVEAGRGELGEDARHAQVERSGPP